MGSAQAHLLGIEVSVEPLTELEPSVTDLAEPFQMTLPAISKHIKVLERAGLIARNREAQWRRCRIQGEALKEAVDYMQQYRRFWEESFDRLDDYVQELKEKQQQAAG